MKQRGTPGHWTIGGVDSVALVRQYGTPLYVLDEQAIRANCRAYVDGFRTYEGGFRVIYAGKALLTSALCRIIEEEGLSLDVVSGGELYTALHASFPVNRIFFHGNNKSEAELTMAVQAGVHRIVVDNEYELDLLHNVAVRLGKVQDILIRLTPGVEVDTHAFIQTGQEDSKFGLDLAHGAPGAIEKARQLAGVRLRGVHFHIGSQLMTADPYLHTIDVAMDFLNDLREHNGYVAEELNLGGGLGIQYVADDAPVNRRSFIETLLDRLRAAASRYDYPLPYIMVEPGRSIVGDAGVTLYTVGSIKRSPHRKTYVAVDGGMGDNPRVALYDARYDAIVANKVNEPTVEQVTVTGKCCESGDMLLWEFDAPEMAPGDILAVLSTGAYNYSMASHYNRLPKPAMVLVNDGQVDVIVERETYADLVRFDVIPDRLKPSGDRKNAD